MIQNIGVIGVTGRMGSILAELINQQQSYRLGASFSRSDKQGGLKDVFQGNDYVIDFSSPKLLKDILESGIDNPKPMVLCTTGWNEQEMGVLITSFSKRAPIVVAPNTSLGACLQHYLSCRLAKILDVDFDIDVTDKHHKHKIDIPSGTASKLIAGIKQAKQEEYKASYQIGELKHGPRPPHYIGLMVERSGNLPGEHEVSFTSEQEMISVKHVAFDRKLFAKGAIKAVEWLGKNNPPPGIYTMLDVLNLT